MARTRRKRQNIEIELFPFLSILACTIGTLILLIIVVTAQSLSDERQVTIVAKTEEGKNATKTPRYIECRSNGVVIYPSEEFVSLSNLERTNSPFQQLLREVRRNRNKEYLIVAIRPDSFDVFEQVRDLIEAQNIDIGYEPIDEGWILKIQSTDEKEI